MSPAKRGIPWWSLASSVWLAGVLFGSAFVICMHIRLWRRLRATQSFPLNEVIAIWEKSRIRLGRGRLVLAVSPVVQSPALIGLFSPVLYLPAGTLNSYSREDLENIFAHEFAHYPRADHWTNAFYLLALAVHWFNPLVWLSYRQLRADRDLAADEWALGRLEDGRSPMYGRTLLKVHEQVSAPYFSMAAVGILEDGSQLKQRIHRIIPPLMRSRLTRLPISSVTIPLNFLLGCG